MRNCSLISTFIPSRSFLSSQGILIQQFIDRGISCQFLAFFLNLRLKTLTGLTVPFVFVLFVLKGIESIEDSSLLFSILLTNVSLGLESAFSLLFSL
jgi:hypothetical protein